MSSSKNKGKMIAGIGKEDKLKTKEDKLLESIRQKRIDYKKLVVY